MSSDSPADGKHLVLLSMAGVQHVSEHEEAQETLA